MSLLFDESPLIAGGIILAGAIGYHQDSKIVMGASVLLLLFMLYFYRYSPTLVGDVNNNTIISPCEGTVLDILDRHEYYYIPIFLSPMNRHTQIYPANCRVLSRVYDRTGQFAMVMNLSKSENNEKKIHSMQLHNGAVMSMTQIAGFLPRMITSAEELNNYKAGDYFGMIKFGSRIDLLIPKVAPDCSIFTIDIQPGMKLNLGEFIGRYDCCN
jgi:phosphatidylserine decarboxylase